jgi:hypothetical protein
MSQRELPTPQNDTDRQILGWVEEFGWAVIGIEEDELGPAYAYSVGLWRGLLHPEIVVVGLVSEAAHQLINDVGDAIKAGKRFELGEEYDGLVPGYKVAFVEVHPSNIGAYLGYACWFNREPDFPAYQCVWPDREGRFPWDDGFDEQFRLKQPLLDIPGDVPGGEGG